MSARQSSLSARPSVMVIDDGPENLRLLDKRLKDRYRVKVALDGGIALAFLRDGERPDLIRLDITMGGLSGYDVIRALKADPGTRDIPVIFLTGLSTTEDERKGFDLGAADYIAKPISPPSSSPASRPSSRTRPPRISSATRTHSWRPR